MIATLYTKVILGAVLVLATAGACLHKGVLMGRAQVQAKWDKDTALRTTAENAAMVGRVKDNEREMEQHALEKQILKKEYADEAALLRDAYTRARGVRIPVKAALCRGPATPAQTSRAPGSDATAPAAWTLSEPYAGDLLTLMQEADTAVAGCRIAQRFIRDSGMAP